MSDGNGTGPAPVRSVLVVEFSGVDGATPTIRAENINAYQLAIASAELDHAWRTVRANIDAQQAVAGDELQRILADLRRGMGGPNDG